MDRNKQAIEVFNRRASEYAEKFMDQQGYHVAFDFFCRAIEKQHPLVLELGCGPGNVTRYLLHQRPDLQITGIDLAPNMIALAKAHIPQADFRIMDVREINSLTARFDAVMCGFCLPYLSKDESIQLITDVAARLGAGGIFCLSTMEDDYEKSGPQKSGSGDDEVYIYYHEVEYLSRSLKKSGFEILFLHRKEIADAAATDLLMVARKK